MSDHHYHIRGVIKREIDIDALARLVLALAQQLAEAHDEDGDEVREDAA